MKVNWSRIMVNKTVLLRERKRHTDRSVSSTPSAVLYQGRGYPIPAGGVPPPQVPLLSWPGRVYPIPAGGYPIPARGPHLGYPPPQTLPGYPPPNLAGYPPPLVGPGQGTIGPRWSTPIAPGWGPPPHQTWLGYPPRCGQTDRHMSKHNLPSCYVRGR